MTQNIKKDALDKSKFDNNVNPAHLVTQMSLDNINKASRLMEMLNAYKSQAYINFIKDLASEFVFNKTSDSLPTSHIDFLTKENFENTNYNNQTLALYIAVLTDEVQAQTSIITYEKAFIKACINNGASPDLLYSEYCKLLRVIVQ